MPTPLDKPFLSRLEKARLTPLHACMNHVGVLVRTYLTLWDTLVRLVASLPHHVPHWGPLGPTFARRGANFVARGAILGPSGRLLGPCWAHVRPRWVHLGDTCAASF